MWGGTDDARAMTTIRSAVDRGISLIDTAPADGFGHAEELVGRALSEAGARHKVVIATKVGSNWHDGKVFRDASRARVIKEVEDSLRRLRTDVIDVHQVHWPDPTVPIQETAEAMLDPHRAGRIRAIGVSNFSVEQMEVFRTIAPLHTAQPPFNLFERDSAVATLPYCRDRGIATLAYGPLVPWPAVRADHAQHKFHRR
jgi:aryl-alcohol dehydrogenase-like predicted oxidoreductase